MKPLTREWINKAEGDWIAAGLLFRARRSSNYDATCFHAQQSAEKYLKARLEEAGVSSGKTHDLVKLLSLVVPVEPSWSVLRQDLIVLTDFVLLTIAIRAVRQQRLTRRTQSNGVRKYVL